MVSEGTNIQLTNMDEEVAKGTNYQTAGILNIPRFSFVFLCVYMAMVRNSGMDRPAVIRTSGTNRVL